MKIGFSIKDSVWEKDERQPHLVGHEDVRELVAALKEQGVRSYELRKLPRVLDKDAYDKCNAYVQQIWDMGLEITIHGELPGDASGERFVDEYPTMAYILQHFQTYQDKLVVTVHAHQVKMKDAGDADVNVDELKADTIAQLKRWTDMVAAEGLPIYFALENNRSKDGAIDPGNSCRTVTEMVTAVNSPHLGICWDVGHFYSNLLNDRELGVPPGESLALPSSEFLSKVCHTHIHSLNKTNGRTHFPLTDKYELPLEQYVKALQQHGYDGAYNLELSFDRYESEMPVMDNVIASVQRLQGVGVPI